MPTPALAVGSATKIEAGAHTALDQLYAESPKFAELAKGIMVFPKIIKGGLVIGGESGDGVLLVDNRPVGYYNMSNASFGLQAGVQGFSYALFLMTDTRLASLRKGTRWDVGGDPSIVFIDQGAAASVDTLATKKSVYAVAWGQKGLMGGIGIKGSRIAPITPKP